MEITEDIIIDDSDLGSENPFTKVEENALNDKAENYSPSQPRDGDGQWTDGGGGGFNSEGFADDGVVVGDDFVINDGSTDQKYPLNNKEKELLSRELARVKVRYFDEEVTKRDDVNGFYRESFGRMELNSNNENKKATFYHEMGHAIDHRAKLGQSQSDAFKGIRKGHPLYADKQYIIKFRMADTIMKKTGLSLPEVIDLDDKAWKAIQKGGFTGFDMPDGSRKSLYIMKSTFTYPSQNDEVFADGYKQFRIMPGLFEKNAPEAFKMYKELTQ